MNKSSKSKFLVNDGTGALINYEIAEKLLPNHTFFIHGNLASNRWWYPAREIWMNQNQNTQLSGNMIFAEFRGCGESSVPKNPSEIKIERLANDFIGLIRSNGWTNVNLVGHSTGGLIAGWMMAIAPELFNKAIFLDPVGVQGVTFDRAMISAFDQMKVDKGLLAAVIGSTIFGNDPESNFFKNIIVPDAHVGVNNVGHLILEALDKLDSTDHISKIRGSVLVLHGEKDVLLPISDSEKMANLIPSGKFQMIEGYGHCLNIENPQKFVEICNSFLF